MRRGWLCGDDPVSGQSYEHRKAWIEERLLELSEVFAVELYGYAIMSNHYHSVIHIDPKRTRNWSKEEVASRWLMLSQDQRPKILERKTAEILADPQRVVELRERLGSVSWFMKYINEPLARMANKGVACRSATVGGAHVRRTYRSGCPWPCGAANVQ